MQSKSLVGLAAVGLVLTVFAAPAQARCDGYSRCDVFKSARTKRLAYGKGNGRLSRERRQVVAMIQSMAPGYGVPAWFALRIAKIESGYNPRARGRAGELGVFQMKCATARHIG